MIKKFLIIMLATLLSCNQEINRADIINKSVVLKDSVRALISALDNPVVDYTLLKDDDDYLDITGEALLDKGGYYALDLELLTGSSYRFTKFNIRSSDKLTYILDETAVDNINGFKIDPGVTAAEPVKLYLKKVDILDFEKINISNITLEIGIDNYSTIGAVENTFKVSSNIDGAEFKIYMYSVYWKLGATLVNNGVFDMDTGKEFSPLETGDGEPWGTGSFKIETTNALGEVVTIIGTAEEWNKKHIELNL